MMRVRGMVASRPAVLLASALALGTVAPARPGAAASAPGQVFRSTVDLVQVPVVITAKDGSLLRGLAREDFQVLEDGAPQTLRFFAAGRDDERVPLHVGILYDVSESMTANLAQASTAAVRFVTALDEAEDVTLVDFDEQVRVARFQPPQFVRLFERIRGQHATGNTALYDAVGMYLQSTAGQEGQRVLLLYTDGGDTTSALSYGQLLKVLKMADVLVYSIGYVARGSGFSREQLQLSQIAAETGGDSFFPQDPRELNEIYARILDEVSSRYTLGYVSSNARHDGSWRKVQVKVLRDDAKKAKVRTRPGYYAPLEIKSP